MRALTKSFPLAKMSCLAAGWLMLCVFLQFCHLQIDRTTEKDPSLGSAVILPQKDVAKFFSMGYEQLLADCWWLSFIQYFGDTPNRKKDHSKYAYAFLDLI